MEQATVAFSLWRERWTQFHPAPDAVDLLIADHHAAWLAGVGVHEIRHPIGVGNTGIRPFRHRDRLVVPFDRLQPAQPGISLNALNPHSNSERLTRDLKVSSNIA